jgi:hypothetical protein
MFDLYQPVVCSTHVVLFLLVPESMFYWHWSGAHIIFCELYGSVYALVWVADTCVLGCSDFHFFHIYGNVSPSLFSLGPKSSELLGTFTIVLETYVNSLIFVLSQAFLGFFKKYSILVFLVIFVFGTVS